LKRFSDSSIGSKRPSIEDDADAGGKLAEARNVGLLREQYRAIARGDLDAAADLFHDDVEFEITGPPAIPVLGLWRGRADVMDAVRRNFGMLDSQAPEVRSVVAQGDVVAVVAHERGRIRTTGAPYALHWVQIVTFRDGKVARVHEIVDGHAIG
jgi:ketosteroid isomerase-like protein